MSATAPPSGHTFATRLDSIEVSSTMAVMIAAQNLKAQGHDVVDLGAGEPDFPTPQNIKAAGIRAIDENFTRYTPATGVPELKDAILERYRRDFGVERRRDEVIATVGGKQSIFNLLMALVDDGDEVIIPAPYWVTFPQVVRLCGGVPVIAEARATDGFPVTEELVRRHMSPRTKVVILNSPANPTGGVIPWAEFLRICRTAADAGAYVLSDECYQRFVYDGAAPYSAAAVPPELRSRVLVSGSLSKTYAMTGWRIGYTIAPPEVAAEAGKIQGHETSNPTSIAQAAAIEALRGPQESVAEMLHEYQRRRDYLVPALRALPGIGCMNPQGAFYVFPDISAHLKGRVKTSDDFCALLLERQRVAVTPGTGFGTDGFLRISYAASMDALAEGVRRLAEFLRSL